MAQRIAKRPTDYIVKFVGYYTTCKISELIDVCKKGKCHAVSILFVIQHDA